MIQNKDFIIGMDLTQLLELVNKSLEAFTANGWSESGREARSAAGEEKEAAGGEEGGVYGEQPAGERQKESESHWLVFIMGLLCHSTAEKQSQLNLRMRYLLFSNNLNNN